jgi:hypothetical protein
MAQIDQKAFTEGWIRHLLLLLSRLDERDVRGRCGQTCGCRAHPVDRAWDRDVRVRHHALT